MHYFVLCTCPYSSYTLSLTGFKFKCRINNPQYTSQNTMSHFPYQISLSTCLFILFSDCYQEFKEWDHKESSDTKLWGYILLWNRLSAPQRRWLCHSVWRPTEEVCLTIIPQHKASLVVKPPKTILKTQEKAISKHWFCFSKIYSLPIFTLVIVCKWLGSEMMNPNI